MIRVLNYEPNVEFDFNVSVSNCILSADTLKSNSVLSVVSVQEEKEEKFCSFTTKVLSTNQL